MTTSCLAQPLGLAWFLFASDTLANPRRRTFALLLASVRAIMRVRWKSGAAWFFLLASISAGSNSWALFPATQANNYRITNNDAPWTLFQGPLAVCSVKEGSTCKSAEAISICNNSVGQNGLGPSSPPFEYTPQNRVGTTGWICEARRSDQPSFFIDAVYKWQAVDPSCPANATLVGGGTQCQCNAGFVEQGSSCVPVCTPPDVNDPETGQCAPTKPGKAVGTPASCTIQLGNPCNAGTGTKFQVESVFRGGAVAPLVEQLSYNSRPLSDAGLIWTGVYGKGWKGHYERQVTVLSSGVALLGRPDGRQLDFRPPASGSIYVADADVADRLERLTDGGGNTTGWKYVLAEDDAQCFSHRWDSETACRGYCFWEFGKK